MKKILIFILISQLSSTIFTEEEQQKTQEKTQSQIIDNWIKQSLANLTKAELEGVLIYLEKMKQKHLYYKKHLNKLLVFSQEEYDRLSENEKEAVDIFMESVLEKENELLDKDLDIRVIMKKSIDFIKGYINAIKNRDEDIDEEFKEFIEDWKEKYLKKLKNYNNVLNYIKKEADRQYFYAEHIDEYFAVPEDKYDPFARDTKNAGKAFIKLIFAQTKDLISKKYTDEEINRKLIQFIDESIKRTKEYINKHSKSHT